MTIPIMPPEIDVHVVRSRVDGPELLADELGSSAWLSCARIIKSDDQSSVLSGDVAGRGVIVKTVLTNPLRSRVPGALGKTRLSRQWRGAELLIDHGLPTVEPVLMWSGKNAKGDHAETLALERVEGSTLIRSFANGGLPVREQHRLAEEAGSLTGRIVRAGLFNRDHKPSNIIVRKTSTGALELVLIDTSGVTRLGTRNPERMLFNLVVEFVGTDTLPRRSVVLRALESYRHEARQATSHAQGNGSPEGVRVIWEVVEQMLQRHGDPTPKDDPLKY